MNQAIAQDTAIDALGLSTRTRNALWRAGLHLVRDVLSRSEDELQGIPGLGGRGYGEIWRKLAAGGFSPPRSTPGARARSSKVRARRAELDLQQTRSALRRLVEVVGRDHPGGDHDTPEAGCETCRRVGEARLHLQTSG